MEAQLKTFFSRPRFAVAGASSDPAKYGHRVFAWYLSHGLPVTPLNPNASSIRVGGRDFATRPSPAALAGGDGNDARDCALSVITPPAVTRRLLREAREAGVVAVWLQPGSFDDETLRWARGAFEAAIAGVEGGEDWVQSAGEEGWCVLVDGERGLKAAGREWERVKL